MYMWHQWQVTKQLVGWDYIYTPPPTDEKNFFVRLWWVQKSLGNMKVQSPFVFQLIKVLHILSANSSLDMEL